MSGVIRSEEKIENKKTENFKQQYVPLTVMDLKSNLHIFLRTGWGSCK
jgi:hypothetical protein